MAEIKDELSASVIRGVESLAGVSLEGVHVHLNSAKPPLLEPAAFAQRDVGEAVGTEDVHLPHEAWHVVQQHAGRVRPSMEVGRIAINDDALLEQESDRMGLAASKIKR